jgi:hypothetical protein
VINLTSETDADFISRMKRTPVSLGNVPTHAEIRRVREIEMRKILERIIKTRR